MKSLLEKWRNHKRSKYAKSIEEMAMLATTSGQIKVKVLADSISKQGKRITTYQLSYWRPIHAEFMTHRVFGRNASSSRAIPVKVILKQVWNNPAMPMSWGANKSGMQAGEEVTGIKRMLSKYMWRMAGRCACCFAWSLMKIGIHKQAANRLLEPWQFIHVVITATEFENFFELRDHDDAQPEIHVLAHLMKQERLESRPVLLGLDEWHLPYITDEERAQHSIDVLKKVSAARCCRVSYMKHDGTNSNVSEDLKLCERLVGSEPLHASPFEHQATPDSLDCRTEQWGAPAMHGNLMGWKQFRKFIEAEMWLNKGKQS